MEAGLIDMFADKPLLQQVLLGIFTLACGLGVVAWFAMITYAIRVPFHAKSGSLHGWFRLNPFNVVFFSDKLTAKGLLMRRRLLISAGCFLGFWALGALSGLVLKFLTQT